MILPTFVATELYSGKLHVFEKGNAVKAIQASSTIPAVFRPVKTDEMMFVDGVMPSSSNARKKPTCATPRAPPLPKASPKGKGLIKSTRRRRAEA